MFFMKPEQTFSCIRFTPKSNVLHSNELSSCFLKTREISQMTTRPFGRSQYNSKKVYQKLAKWNHIRHESAGGELSYNGGYGCAARTFKPLPFANQNFGKILDPL